MGATGTFNVHKRQQKLEKEEITTKVVPYGQLSCVDTRAEWFCHQLSSVNWMFRLGSLKGLTCIFASGRANAGGASPVTRTVCSDLELSGRCPSFHLAQGGLSVSCRDCCLPEVSGLQHRFAQLTACRTVNQYQSCALTVTWLFHSRPSQTVR